MSHTDKALFIFESQHCTFYSQKIFSNNILCLRFMFLFVSLLIITVSHVFKESYIYDFKT